MEKVLSVQEFEDFFNSHYSRMVGYTLRVISPQGTQEDAEDVTLYAFEKAWKFNGTFEGRSEYISWFFRILRNEIKMYWRHNKVREKEVSLFDGKNEEGETFTYDVPVLPEQELAPREAYILSLIRHLHPENQQIVELLIDGFSREEISQMLGLPLSTLKVRIFRVRKQLRLGLDRGYPVRCGRGGLSENGAKEFRFSQNHKTLAAGAR